MSSLPGYRTGLGGEYYRDGRDAHQTPQLCDSLYIDPRIFPIAEILPIKKVQVIEPVIE
jgi:hypothetical protein